MSEKVTGLVRTKGGTVIHRATCRTVTGGITSTGVPWDWAEGRDLDEVSSAIAMVGARACRVCRPLQAQDAKEAH